MNNMFMYRLGRKRGGGTAPTLESLSVTENGTYTPDNGVDGFNSVTVNVQASGGGDAAAIIDRSITEISDDAATVVGAYAFYECRKLTSVSLPSATTVGNRAFYNCSALTTASLDKAKTLGEYVFYNCTSLSTVDCPTATSIGLHSLKGCTALTTVNFPKVTYVAQNVFDSCKSLTETLFPELTIIAYAAFTNCTSLKTADFPKLYSMNLEAFKGCQKLTALILRSETMCSISDTASFSNTPIAQKTGYVYVPSALIDSYKTATNWSTYATQFRALEDYTVDGTTTGALDPTKI